MLTALTLATLELKMAKKCSLTTRASLTLRVWTPVLTTPPTGYSACDKTKIVISATHDEHNVNLSGESNLNNKIINKKAGGITLPSTGGIGTTLFYVVGGGLMVAAIVLLVTKKRMENK